MQSDVNVKLKLHSQQHRAVAERTSEVVILVLAHVTILSVTLRGHLINAAYQLHYQL